MQVNSPQVTAEQVASAVTTAALKNGPPAAVVGASWLGFPLQEWVYLATLVWIGYQFCAAVYDRFLAPKRPGRRPGK